jgi:hypothetical protein
MVWSISIRLDVFDAWGRLGPGLGLRPRPLHRGRALAVLGDDARDPARVHGPCLAPDEDFDAFVRQVHELGHERMLDERWYRCLEVGGWHYLVQGTGTGDTSIIRRARLDGKG